MSKIYSRPRLKIPKLVFYKKGNNETKEKKITLIMIILIASITLKVAIDAINPIFDSLCEKKAISIATIVSNSKATEVMKQHSYDELYTIEKDANDNITMINANVIPINEITSDIAIKIQEEINRQGSDNVEIALRKFYRNKVASWSWTKNKNKNILYWKCQNRFKK